METEKSLVWWHAQSERTAGEVEYDALDLGDLWRSNTVCISEKTIPEFVNLFSSNSFHIPNYKSAQVVNKAWLTWIYSIASWRHLTLPSWMYYFLIVTNVTDFWSMIYACLVQDVDSQLGLPTILFHAIFYAPFALICKWIEGLVILYTILRPPKGFYVVAK